MTNVRKKEKSASVCIIYIAGIVVLEFIYWTNKTGKAAAMPQYMQCQAADNIILFYLRQLNLQLKEAGQ